MRRLLAVAVLATMVVGTVVLTATAAGAHPLGNFSVNHYDGIVVGTRGVEIDYVVDAAELPTYQLRHRVDPDGDGTATVGERDAFASGACRASARRLVVRVDDRIVVPRIERSEARLHPGQGGLRTLRLECTLHAPAAVVAAHRLRFEDRNDADRVGWREITVVGDRMTITTPGVARESITDRLSHYPEDRVASPPRQRAIDVSLRAGGPPAPHRASPVDSVLGARYERLTSLLSSSVGARRLTLGLALVALAAAIALGALHAIAPGHGKTVMAAYIVGGRGSLRHALVLGTTVATTHTVGVLTLGFVLAATQAFAPERLYPWFGVASGVCFAALGAALLWRALTRRGSWHGHAHGHPHHDRDHQHDHHGDHHNDHHHSHHDDHAVMSHRQLLALGFAGGLVPTPSAVIVLLGASAIGRAWFGVALVIAYGVGLAATLLAAGVLLSVARRRFESHATSDRLLRLAAVVPIGTAVLVTGGGLLLVLRAAVSV